MKKLMLVAAVVIASVSAHASKARLDSLQFGNGARHLNDIRDAFDGEAEETVNYEAAIVEFGPTSPATGANAEGGFIRKMGDAAIGFYMGKPSQTYADQAGAIATGLGTSADEDNVMLEAVEQSNPILLTYGAKMGGMAWGLGVFYHAKDEKAFTNTSGAETLTGKIKQDVAGIYGGVNNGVWDAQLRVGLMGNTKVNAATSTLAAVPAGAEVKGESKGNIKASGGYRYDTMYFYGWYEGIEGEAKLNGNKIGDTTKNTITVGVVNSHKKDGIDFFYGANYASILDEDKGNANRKTESSLLKALAGVEAEANSWLVLRGAISQNLPMISTVKTKGSSASSAASSTTTTMGAGFKWGKATVDVVAGMGSTGNFTNTTGGDIFTNGSITYNF